MRDSSAEFGPSALVVSPDRHVPDDMGRALEGLQIRWTYKQLAVDEPTDFMGAPDILILRLPEGAEPFAAEAEALVAQARQIHCPVVLSAPLALFDALPDNFWNQCHAFLADAEAADVAASVAVALSTRPGLLSDVSRDMDAVRLQRLADEVGRIARTLSSLSAAAPLTSNSVGDMRPSFYAEPVLGDQAVSARAIRAMIRTRRLRDRFFDSHLFADPAWDMLLDLMAARLERVQVAVSSLCIAACVPPTTALRWIKMMTDSGLFERVADPVDGRRIFIRLSDQTANAMTQLLTTIRAADDLLV